MPKLEFKPEQRRAKVNHSEMMKAEAAQLCKGMEYAQLPTVEILGYFLLAAVPLPEVQQEDSQLSCLLGTATRCIFLALSPELLLWPELISDICLHRSTCTVSGFRRRTKHDIWNSKSKGQDWNSSAGKSCLSTYAFVSTCKSGSRPVI